MAEVEAQLAEAEQALSRGDYRRARAIWAGLPAEVRASDPRAQQIDRQTGTDPLGLILGVGGGLLLLVLTLLAYGRAG